MILYGLDYVNEQAIESLAAEVPKISIHDQSGKESHMHYTLKNIRISGFTKPSSSLALVPSGGLSWSANNAGVSVHADWKVRWYKLSSSGSVDVSVNGVSFSVTVTLGKGPSGQLTVKTESCQSNVGGVNVQVHGKLKRVLKLFRNKVESEIRNMLRAKMCQTVNAEINKNAEIQLTKLKVPAPRASTTPPRPLMSAPARKPVPTTIHTSTPSQAGLGPVPRPAQQCKQPAYLEDYDTK
ncbi:hypothetical protein ACOMHN_040775 [Nucella lapillus]